MELDLEFKRGQPIRQGDVFGFWDWRTKPSLARFGLVITADCDIENGQPDQDLVYLRVITQADYIEIFWSRAKLGVVRKTNVRDLTGQINKLRRARDAGAPDLTIAEVEQWITSESPANIADAIGGVEAREAERLSRNIDDARNSVQLATLPLGTACLDHLVTVRGRDRANILKQAANDLRSERDDIFFLTSLIDPDDATGYYVLLDHIGAVAKDQLSDSIDAVSRGVKVAYRFGTLAQIYKYAVAQRFAFLFQRIGLPNDHKHRHEATLARINSMGGDT